MAWMLQPHNWTQAVRPNLYNVGYRRNLAYKGMGAFALPPPAPPLGMTYRPTMTTAYWGVRGLGQDTSSTPMVDVYQLSTDGQLLSTSQYVGSAPSSVVTPQTQNVNPSTTGFLSNTNLMLIGGAVLFLLVLAGGRR